MASLTPFRIFEVQDLPLSGCIQVEGSIPTPVHLAATKNCRLVDHVHWLIGCWVLEPQGRSADHAIPP